MNKHIYSAFSHTTESVWRSIILLFVKKESKMSLCQLLLVVMSLVITFVVLVEWIIGD